MVQVVQYTWRKKPMKTFLEKSWIALAFAAALWFLPGCDHGDRGIGGTPPPVNPLLSSVTIEPEEPVPADGISEVRVKVQLIGENGGPVYNRRVFLMVRGKDLEVEQPRPTSADGVTEGAVRTRVSQVVAISVVVQEDTCLLYTSPSPRD